MVNEGLVDRFGIQEVFDMHIMPRLPVSEFRYSSWLVHGGGWRLHCRNRSSSGTCRVPHECVDTTLVGTQIVNALKSMVSCAVPAVETSVASVGSFHITTATTNDIPDTLQGRHRRHARRQSAELNRSADAPNCGAY
ncbi:hypothetical protein [Bradyrhizobium sp. CW10]|uniref:hypothetical protein n=1 Tax=Bradyrhizobium sp. CW10 TaxID=2782683 RepID=UPI001FF70FBF|nr:hypothetical protein [Bradyrhizobium sp. CW10]MCK1468828.1 hypothetical protein [Bradyrhizobium sp. CW10]